MAENHEQSENKTETASAITANAESSAPKQTTRLQLLFRIALVVLFFAFVFGAIGLCLPRSHEVATSIEIEAPPEVIFPLIEKVSEWRHWAPAWDFMKDDNITFSYNKNFTAVTWRHNLKNQVGKMWMDREHYRKNESITYIVEHESLEEMPMISTIDLKPTESGTTIVFWQTNADLPRTPILKGVFYGWAGLMFTGGLTAQYDRDLIRLKELAETNDQLLIDKKKEDVGETPSF